MLSEQDIAATIRRVLRERVRADGGLVDIADDVDVVEALALDSLEQLTLVVEVENAFRICLEEDAAEHVRSIGQLARYVRQSQAAQAKAGPPC